MTKELYIGTRAEWADITKILNRSVSRLNQSMSKTLRTIAMKQGIKKTEQGCRLDFFAVSQDEMDRLCSEKHQMFQTLKGNDSLRPLIAVDAAKMMTGINDTNSRYNSRMDSATHRKYIAELEKAVEDAVVKIGEDLNTRKQAAAIGDNPFSVGDLVVSESTSRLLGRERPVAGTRIYKSTKKYVWLEHCRVKCTDTGGWFNNESVGNVFNDTETAGENHWYTDSCLFIPEASNADELEWVKETSWGNKLVRHRWDKIYNKVVKPGDADVGYTYFSRASD